MTDLPPGWTHASLADLGTWLGGGTPSKRTTSFWDGQIPWVSPKDMKMFRIRDAEDHITDEAVIGSATSLVPPPAVLVVTRSGILRHTLPVAVTDREVAINQDLKALVPGPGVVSDYVAWCLRAYASTILDSCSKSGTTVQSVETARLLDFAIPVAPTAEQRRIVAAIEEHFARLDAAEDLLRHTERMLVWLRSSLVARALSGDWPTCGLGDVTENQIYGTSAKADENPLGVPVLRMGNIRDGSIDLTDLKYLPSDHPDVGKCRLIPGDLLFNRTNSPELVGKSAVFMSGPDPTIFASYLIRVRLTPDCDPRWASLVINSALGRQYMASVRTQQVGQANVNGTKLAAMRIPIPPIEVQRRILGDLGEWAARIEAMNCALETALRRSAALRRSILDRAFTGRLVQQRQEDQPAAAFLEQIAATRRPRPALLVRHKAPA